MSRNDRLFWVGGPIVIFWMAMMGLMLHHEFGTKRLDAAAVTSSRVQEPSESWLGISLAEGRRVGTIHLRQAPRERHGLAGLEMTLDARMSLNLLGKSTDLDVTGSVWRPERARRAEFEFIVRSAGHDFQITGGVADGELSSEIVSAGETIPLSLPIDDDVIFASGMGSAMRFPALEVGEEYLIDSFDPLTLSKSRARVRCTAQEMLRIGSSELLTRRLTIATNGLRSTAWIDAAGEVVKAETSIGLVIERLDGSELEPTTAEPGEIVDLLSHTAIRPSGLRPFRSARTMTVRLAGLEEPDLPLDRVQTALGDGRYRLRVPAEPPSGAPLSTDPSALARYLEADAFSQSDHPRIAARATAIVGAETDGWAKARAIHDWVFSRLEKEAVLSIPSALEVLEQRRGDCNEHTILFTALARSVGLPTRIAIGIVWSDELDGFYYHAWPEVFLGDWLWMDPTLDQPLADATHIKLLNGGIESWPRLLPYLGRLEVEILEIE